MLGPTVGKFVETHLSGEAGGEMPAFCASKPAPPQNTPAILLDKLFQYYPYLMHGIIVVVDAQLMKSGICAGTSFWASGTLPSDDEDDEMSASANPGRLEVSLKFLMHSSTCGLC